MRKLLASLLVSSTLILAGCNTVKGVGQDIESVGKTGEEVIN